MTLSAPFRMSDLGPIDDHDADAFDRARDAILDDADECAAVAAAVKAANVQLIDELCSAAYTREGSANIGRQLHEAAERELDKRAQRRVESDRERAALARG